MEAQMCRNKRRKKKLKKKTKGKKRFALNYYPLITLHIFYFTAVTSLLLHRNQVYKIKEFILFADYVQ